MRRSQLAPVGLAGVAAALERQTEAAHGHPVDDRGPCGIVL